MQIEAKSTLIEKFSNTEDKFSLRDINFFIESGMYLTFSLYLKISIINQNILIEVDSSKKTNLKFVLNVFLL